MPSLIPAFTASGVLPPYTGSSPTRSANRAPYKTNIQELCSRFGTSTRRVAILESFIEYRGILNRLGFVNGFQWCDGSFVEDKDPSDMDVVTFTHRPAQAQTTVQLRQLMQQNLNLFNPRLTKQNYHCEVFFVDFGLAPDVIVSRTHYWFGLFSHRRVTAEWKGLVEIPLHSPTDDRDAGTILASIQQPQAPP
jgi:hypothetical protein